MNGRDEFIPAARLEGSKLLGLDGRIAGFVSQGRIFSGSAVVGYVHGSQLYDRRWKYRGVTDGRVYFTRDGQLWFSLRPESAPQAA
ncbi:MAG TPA: hypothetical protein VGB99_16065 [Acidobacteriota bacterium]